jgi:hypothetical protein
LLRCTFKIRASDATRATFQTVSECVFSETPQPRSYWPRSYRTPRIGPASSVACEDKKKGRGDTLALANAGAVVGGQPCLFPCCRSASPGSCRLYALRDSEPEYGKSHLQLIEDMLLVADVDQTSRRLAGEDVSDTEPMREVFQRVGSDTRRAFMKRRFSLRREREEEE